MTNFDKKTPIDVMKESKKLTIDDFMTANEKRLKNLKYSSSDKIRCNFDNYDLPEESVFLHEKWNQMYEIKKMAKYLQFKRFSVCIASTVKNAEINCNDKSNDKHEEFYIVTFKNKNGKILKDVEIKNNAKTDIKQFQAKLNSCSNCFNFCCTERQFIDFFDEYISQKANQNIRFYKNPGTTPDGFLYENALATPNGIIWANEDGYVELNDGYQIKILPQKHKMPRLAKSNKSGQEIACDLLKNILDCWSKNVVLPLIVLGHFIMSVHYEYFAKHYGVPVLVLFGSSGTGKSTLVVLGSALFGLYGLTAGNSSTASNEHLMSKYNGIMVCIDDITPKIFNSENFIALTKGVYKGVPRTKMRKDGADYAIVYVQTCSPLTCTSNESPPNLKEVNNRLNVVRIFENIFEASRFNYHESNSAKLKELSLILPEMIKIPREDVISLYSKVFNLLEENVPKTQNRIISNIAFAYTGALLLLSIADIEVSDLDNKIIEYTRKQVEYYEKIKTPVDKVLTEIAVLHELEVIRKDLHFKIGPKTFDDGTTELCIRFKKDVILSIINKYYAHDKSKYINEDLFLSYAKPHPRYRGQTTARLLDIEDIEKPNDAMLFCIEGLEEYANFGSMISPMSAEELANNIRGNAM